MTDGTGFRESRRAVLWTGVGALATTLIPARAGAQPKIAPKLVQYQEKPKGPQECDNCLHFVAPSSGKAGASSMPRSRRAESVLASLTALRR